MIDRTPLDVTKLSPGAQKALGPGPGKMMASRGIMPLPPAEQVAVLYQISLDADQTLAMSARSTALALPETLVAGALANASLDARVIDFFAELAGDKPAVFEAIVQGAATADETIARLAGKAGAKEIERIAANEQRLLRHPEIIAAMYTNKAARMSTVDRVVELAVRNNVRVPGLVAWDEIARALSTPNLGTTTPAADQDAVFAQAAEAASGDDSAITQTETPDGELPPDEELKALQIYQLGVPAKVRLAQLGNAFARSQLVRDPVKIVAVAAIKSQGVSELEVQKYAANPGLCDDVIRYIASKREWTKNPSVRFSLCRNPKTPVTDSMRMMPFLRDKELTAILNSKGVPSAVVAQARKLMMQRRGGPQK